MKDKMRLIEREVDNYHKKSKVFTYTHPTAVLNALRVFEDGCRLGAVAVYEKTGDLVDYSMEIREQLNSLDTALKWIHSECKPDISIDLSIDERYKEFSELHNYYARRYFGISNAYISYSRRKYLARVNEKTKRITFTPINHLTDIVSANFTEALQNHTIDKMDYDVSPDGMRNLIASIQIVDNRISYNISEETWREVRRVFNQQWLDSSELPLEWVFDKFSLKEFMDVWVTVTSWMMIHSIACLHSGVIGLALEEVVLVKERKEIIDFILKRADLSESSVSNIINYLIYDQNIKNNDIVFQPFISLYNEWIAFCPHLFLHSRPERNLITLIHKKKDRSYFNLTNLKEDLMLKEITKNIFLLVDNGKDSYRVQKLKESYDKRKAEGKNPAEIIIIDARPKSSASNYKPDYV